MIQTKRSDTSAAVPVADYASALKWYERLSDFPPAFLPQDTAGAAQKPRPAQYRSLKTA